MTTPTPPRRCWFRFRLRTLLIFVAVVAVPLAWIAKERRQSRYEVQFAEELREKGFNVYLGGPNDSVELEDDFIPMVKTSRGLWPDFARRVLGERITAIENWNVASDFNDLTLFAKIRNLQYLDLRRLHVSHLDPLTRHKRLNVLWLAETDVGDLAPLAGLTELQSLWVQNTKVSELKPLAELRKLQNLCLRDTVVTDLTPLAELRNLKLVDVRNSLVTKWDVEYLRHALPNCKIEHDPFTVQ